MLIANLIPAIVFFGGLLWLNAWLKRRKRQQLEPKLETQTAPRRGGRASAGLFIIGALMFFGGALVAMNAYEQLSRTFFRTDEMRLMFWGGGGASAAGLGLLIGGIVASVSRRTK